MLKVNGRDNAHYYQLCQKDKTICIYKLKMKYIDIYLSRSIKFFTILAH